MGCKLSLPNYQNNELIPIINQILPNVYTVYKEEFGEDTLWTKHDLLQIPKLNRKRPNCTSQDNHHLYLLCFPCAKDFQVLE